MDIYCPADIKLVSNVAREAKRVAHPCLTLSRPGISNSNQRKGHI